MRLKRSLNVVGVHAAGEIGEVIVGGVLDVPLATMFEKMIHFKTKADHIRQLLVNEPRGRAAMTANLILSPCVPEADAGVVFMGAETYTAMSGSNTICVVTALLETGMVEMKEPTTQVTLDTAAGLVTAMATCKAGKCESVSFDNVPAFVYGLDLDLALPGFGTIKVDIAYGGQFYAIIDALQLGLKLEPWNGARLVEIGEMIRKVVDAQIVPVHPENPGIRGINNIQLVYPLENDGSSDNKVSTNTVIVPPGRVDRSPCGTGTSARLAVLHARKQLQIGQKLRHRSTIGSEFVGYIRDVTKVGPYDAVLPNITGSAWITSFKQYVLDPTDPFPAGFRVGDAWHVPRPSDATKA